VNLHVHFHVLVLDGVFARDAEGHLVFHPAPPPTASDLDAIVERTARRSMRWLRKRGYCDDTPLEARSNEPPAQTALDACATIAMGRGTIATPPRDGEQDDAHSDAEERPDKPVLAVERDGFNVHAGVRIAAGDDLGRERLARYGARPPLSLERLRLLPGGRVAWRFKYVDRGRKGKLRVMTAMELMARLSTIIAPPRFPLVRYGGVLAPRSAWRREVVPKPRERSAACKDARRDKPAATDRRERREPGAEDGRAPRPPSPREQGVDDARAPDGAAAVVAPPPRAGDIIMLTPNVISVGHWDRLLGGLLYATQPRVDWATLLRRSFAAQLALGLA
jgi:hypothetical protein